MTTTAAKKASPRKATTRTKKAAPLTPAAKAAATRAASAGSSATQVCAACNEKLPVRRFPTASKADGTVTRGATCRACARARRTTT